MGYEVVPYDLEGDWEVKVTSVDEVYEVLELLGEVAIFDEENLSDWLDKVAAGRGQSDFTLNKDLILCDSTGDRAVVTTRGGMDSFERVIREKGKDIHWAKARLSTYYNWLEEEDGS